jgi:hypothetical protein
MASGALVRTRLPNDPELWAALTTGDTRGVLAAVRAGHPASLLSIREFVHHVQQCTVEDLVHVPLQLHTLLEQEAETVSRDTAQQARVRDALEKLVTTRIHPIVFGRGDEGAEQDATATLHTARRHLTAARLGIPPAFADSSSWSAAALMLRHLGSYRAPADKVALIVNACRLIERRLYALAHSNGSPSVGSSSSSCDDEEGGKSIGTVVGAGTGDDGSLDGVDSSCTVVGADEFFPVLVWVVLLAAPPLLTSELAYIKRYRHPDRLRGVSGCYYTHLCAAVHFLQSEAVTNWDQSSTEPATELHEEVPPGGNAVGEALEARPAEADSREVSTAISIGLYSAPNVCFGDDSGGGLAAGVAAISKAGADTGVAPASPTSPKWREWSEWLFSSGTAQRPTSSSHVLRAAAYEAATTSASALPVPAVVSATAPPETAAPQDPGAPPSAHACAVHGAAASGDSSCCVDVDAPGPDQSSAQLVGLY